MERIATIGVKIDDAWKLLLAAVGATAHAMVENEGLRTLILTSAQRETLKGELRRVFGPGVEAGMKAGQRFLEGSAGMMYGFLNDLSWKTH